MTGTLRDLLRRDADAVDVPTIDANDIVGRGEQRRRRRRRTAVLAAVTAVAVVAVGGIVAGNLDERSGGPADDPARPDRDQRPVPAQPRKIVWSNDMTELSPGNDTPETRLGVLHVGDREVEIGQVLHSVRDWSMYVVDDGAVYAQDDRTVWFTDGGPPRRIGSHACVISAGTGLGLATGNAGSLVAWFDCAPDSRGDLVVYDTREQREVARHRVPSCAELVAASTLPSSRAACLPDAILGQHVYVGRYDDDGGSDEHALRFDVTSGQVDRAGHAVFRADLRSRPRALVLGDSRRGGTPTEATGDEDVAFLPVGRRLVPADLGDPSVEDDDAVTRAFDTATGRPVRFRLPPGYQPRPTDVPIAYTIFEWLDDDTVALAEGGFSVVGDVLVCHLSDGRCRFAPGPSRASVVPTLPLPG
jgi:hypothetical protein